jgi:hypothetical protein
MTANGQIAEMPADRQAGMRLENEPRPLITGQESLDELRKKIIELSQASSARQIELRGPFHIMGSLSHDSLKTLVNSLSREACLDLFKMEQTCCLQADTLDSIKSHGGT